MIDPPCPQCGEELTPVPSIWLDNTAPFWSPTKAGEWLCTNCPDNGKGRHGVAYFWEHEVKHESMSDEPLPFAEGLTFKPDEPCPYCRINQLEVENAKLRRAIDDIKIRSYELGQRELHDMALDVLKENDK